MTRGLGIVFVEEKMMRGKSMGHFIWMGLQREVRAPWEGVRMALLLVLLLLLQQQAVPPYYRWEKPPWAV